MGRFRMAEAKTRPMDEPDIDARQFLSRVMHEPTVALEDRMRAADILLSLGLGDYKEEVVNITIRTRDPRLEDLSAEKRLDNLLGRRRYEPVDRCVAYWDMKGVKGHA
jgi:hypothetical protein